ncbi:hypothetical protein ABKA04_003262 [Annulohypoxylon sp. FPYF3050]
MVAVKVAKLNIGRTFQDMGTNKTERRRLEVILFELDMLSQPSIRQHPNIASVLGFSWDDTSFGYAPCLIMELATLGTARNFTTSRSVPLSDPEKLTLCREVAYGLSFLHKNNIVHGDVKQDNVLIYEDKNAPVGFVAKLSDLERCPGNSESQTYTGTALYNAPEVHGYGHSSRISPSMLWACDVFSFGLLSFEILASTQWREILPTRDQARSIEMENKTLRLAQEIIQNNWIFSKELQGVCSDILEATLAEDPSQRRSLDVVLDTLSYNHDQDSTLRDELGISSHIDSSISILEIYSHAGSIFDERLGTALWFDLNHTVTHAEDDEQRGRAAFNVFLLYSNCRYGQYKSVQEALELLKTSAEFQYGPAFIVGKRIFEANGYGDCLPSIFQEGPNDPGLGGIIQQLESLPSSEYYSSAVAIFWLPKLRLDALKALPTLTTRVLVGSISELVPAIQNLRQTISKDEFRNIAQNEYLLHHGVANGSHAACSMLIQSGCDVNSQMPGGMTSLHLACRCAHVDIVKLLIEHAADISINDDSNISPLHWLILFPKEDILEVATLFGTKLGDRKSDAASSKSTHSVCFDDLGLILYESAKCFLDLHLPLSKQDMERICYGVGSNVGDFNFWFRHGISFNSVYKTIFDLLEQFGLKITLDSSNITDMKILNPLCRAVMSYNVPLVKELLRRNADINDRSQDFTALEWAFLCSDATGPRHKVHDTIRVLLENGANTGPEPPLYKASSYFMDSDVIQLLVDQDPQSINTIYKGFTPVANLLSLDIKDDLMAKVQIMTAPPFINLDVESPHSNDEGCCYTALAHSLVNLEWPVAKCLLDRNAKLELGTRGGHQSTVLHLLIQHAYSMQSKEHTVDWGMLLATIDNLLEYQASKEMKLVNTRDYRGVTPLGMAVQFKFRSLVERLLRPKYGIDRAIVEAEQHFMKEKADLDELDTQILKYLGLYLHNYRSLK